MAAIPFPLAISTIPGSLNHLKFLPFVAKQSHQITKMTKQNVQRFLIQSHVTITRKDLVTFVFGSVERVRMVYLVTHQ